MRLLVLLASPPVTSGRRTLSRLASLPQVLPCSSVTIANLYSTPAIDLPALSEVGASPDGWLRARGPINEALANCDEIMAAWGLFALAGPARRHRSEQLSWLLAAASSNGIDHVWTIEGQPRHPSRWHQYVSDVHQRTAGGTFEERLRQVLIKVPLTKLA